jgi:hypothetical protein
VVITDGDLVDEIMAAFLRAHGQAGALAPPPGPDPNPLMRARPVECRPVDTPRYIRSWFADEVAAGRLIVAEKLPAPAVLRQVREAAAVSRSTAAEQLGVTAEAIRLWENGAREPAGDNPDRVSRAVVRVAGRPARTRRARGGQRRRAGRRVGLRRALVPDPPPHRGRLLPGAYQEVRGAANARHPPGRAAPAPFRRERSFSRREVGACSAPL